jgi:tubulin---tyrosine ligase
MEDGYHLSNKKALFLNMRFYYEALGQNPFDALPVTFHVKSGIEDPEF